MIDPSDLLLGLLTAGLSLVFGNRLLGLTVNHRDTLGFQRHLFLVAFAIRFAVSLGLYVLGGTSVIGEGDAVGWFFGEVLRLDWESRSMGLLNMPAAWLQSFQGNHQGYFYLLATLFSLLGGPSRLAAAALNCAIGALGAVFAYRLARLLLGERLATRVGWWTCLFPSMIIWSAQTIKEPVVVLLETLALYGITAMRRSGFSLRHLLLCVMAVIGLLPFRFYAAYIAAGAIALGALIPRRTQQNWSLSSAALAALLVVGMMVLAPREARFESYDIDFIQRFRYNIAVDTGSGVMTGYDMTTTRGFGIGTAVGAAHVLLAPFPWQLASGSLRLIIVAPEMVYWWWMFFVGVVPGIRWATKNRLGDVASLLLFVVGMGLVYSMMFGNVGLVYRQRAQLLPWLFVFAAVGLELREQRKAQTPVGWRPRPGSAAL